MRTGTKSILFGVHQFVLHPVTVALAWFALYGQWPKWHEWVAIVTHDLGYVGCAAMDDEEGQRHPIKGAEYAKVVTRWLGATFAVLAHPVRMHYDSGFRYGQYAAIEQQAEETHDLAIGHSRFYAKKYGVPLSKLFAADKASIYFDPQWLYLLRAKFSGELPEYIKNSKLPAGTTPKEWHNWYLWKVGQLL